MDKKTKHYNGFELTIVPPQKPQSEPSTETYHKRGLESENVPPQPGQEIIKR